MRPKKQFSQPEVSASAQKELDKVEKQFEVFNENVKSLTLDRMNAAPKQETEGPQISSKDAQKSNDIYLKPKRSLPPGVNPKTGEREKFNEKWRKDYEYKTEYVQFIAENKEIGGEAINDLWTKPFPGMDCESWDVPVNKPVWGPRHLADKIKRSSYHRLVMQENKINSADGMGHYYGTMAVDSIIQRLDAHPVSKNRSIFMGSNF